MGTSKTYAVAIGRTVGLFSSWSDCEKQVKGFSGAIYKSFKAKSDAETFLQEHRTVKTISSSSNNNNSDKKTSGKRSLSNDDDDSSRSVPPPPSTKRAKNAPTTATATSTSTSNTRTPDLSLLVSFDGGSRGNPGLSGSGAEVVSVRRAAATPIAVGTMAAKNDSSTAVASTATPSSSTKVLTRSKTRLVRYLRGTQTNNQAEYWGLIAGLECVYEKLEAWIQQEQEQHQEELQKPRKSTTINIITATTPMTSKQQRIVRVVQLVIQGDSNLVIQQMKGAYKVGEALLPNFQRAREWMRKIQMICTSCSSTTIQLDCSLQHVYRKDNKIADQCANQAMDARKSWSVHADSEGEETRVEMPDIEPFPYKGKGGGKRGRKVHV